MPTKQPVLEDKHVLILEALGERIRLARLRRGLSMQYTAEKAGISRMTLYRAEAGNPAIALGSLIRILWILSLDSDLGLVARDDRIGRTLQDDQLTPRRSTAGSQRPKE